MVRVLMVRVLTARFRLMLMCWESRSLLADIRDQLGTGARVGDRFDRGTLGAAVRGPRPLAQGCPGCWCPGPLSMLDPRGTRRIAVRGPGPLAVRGPGPLAKRWPEC